MPAVVSANKTASQTTNASVNTINFTNEVLDNRSTYGGTTTFTAPENGVYSVSANLSLTNSTATKTDDSIGFSIMKNGSTNVGSINIDPNYLVTDGAEIEQSINRTIPLSAGDTITITLSNVSNHVVINAGSSLDIHELYATN